MSNRKTGINRSEEQKVNVPAVPSGPFDGYSSEYISQSKRSRFRTAYNARGYRMYAPFLTQLSTQYDSVETANVERQERRRMAKKSYERDATYKFSPPALSKLHNFKV